LTIIYFLFAFLFGTAIGSFLNVLIYRIPIGISIIKPGSFCPKCNKPIKWYENIPIFSFIFLNGKCSKCKESISIHYLIVEVLTGFVFLYLFYRYNLRIDFYFYLFFFCSLIVTSGIDFTHQIIPNITSIPGIVIAVVFQLAKGNLVPGLVGMFFGGGLILLIRVLGNWAYKKEVMGLGDVYLTAMIGGFVGFPFIIPSIFIAAFVGSIFGIIYLSTTHQSRENPIPFGPFLSIGGVTIVLFKTEIFYLLSKFGFY